MNFGKLIQEKLDTAILLLSQNGVYATCPELWNRQDVYFSLGEGIMFDFTASKEKAYLTLAIYVNDEKYILNLSSMSENGKIRIKKLAKFLLTII